MQFRDDLGRSLRLEAPPRRIVSLCPSQTETLFALGLGEQIVGVTRYCIHPSAKERFSPSPLWGGVGEGVETKTKVGGTKQLDFTAIAQLEPDLIIAEKEENRREDVERLSERWPVFVTDVSDIEAALRMIGTLGSLCDRAREADQLAQEIAGRWAPLRPALRPATKSPRTLYLIWRKPYMAAGTGSYIHSVLQRCGFTNVIAKPRYPELTLAEMQQTDPELILLSSEPYPFAQRHVEELAAHLPQARIELVDGEMFSWYGVRMLKAADYLPELVSKLAD
ncbi:MAG: ABC transporter substrate-binding protein [Nevskiales bacterium]